MRRSVTDGSQGGGLYPAKVMVWMKPSGSTVSRIQKENTEEEKHNNDT